MKRYAVIQSFEAAYKGQQRDQNNGFLIGDLSV